MADLSLQNLTKTYPGGTVAVEGASIDVADGEFIVMVGPSGCGKSTTLRMIAGLERITTGRLEIAGREVNNVEPGERDIAMVFQNYALYPHMTVYRNMSYGLRNEGLPKPEIETRINEAAEMLQLTQLLDRKPRQLSGGQRQRVAMGRAIVRHPAVFLFDEPLSNLDAKLRTQLRAELKSLHARLGATFVYVTHDQVEAMSLADRIVVMNEGKIEQIGAPMELYHAPASRFVAEFIGSPAMNMIDGEISTDGLAVMADGDVLATFSTPQERAGEKVTIGIRPEHLIPGAVGGVNLNLSSVLEEQLGADTLLHCALGGQTITLRRNGSEPALTGDFTAGATEFHIFDPET